MTKKFTFKDSANHEWDVTLTMGTVFQLRSCSIAPSIFPAPINLTNPSKEFLELITSDAGALFALIYQIVSSQAEKVYGKTDTELKFLQNVDSETIEKAREAFYQSMSFFCPRVKTFFTQHSRLLNQGMKMVETKLKETGPEFMKLLEEEADRATKQLVKELKGLSGIQHAN